MPVEENIKIHINDLINSAQELKKGDSEYNQARSEEQVYNCTGWISSAFNLVQLICTDQNNAYRKRAASIENNARGWSINQKVGEFSALLTNLLHDIENGLLASVSDQARAETFDNFLDHAKEYLKENLKNEAGVIAGVVFEDSLRRVYRKNGFEDKDEKLDTLINALAKNNIISQTKAKRAKVAAHVRTKATHAQWDEFDIEDVKVTIEFTEELVLSHLE
jgi:predicted nucleic acid-binding protein